MSPIVCPQLSLEKFLYKKELESGSIQPRPGGIRLFPEIFQSTDLSLWRVPSSLERSAGVKNPLPDILQSKDLSQWRVPSTNERDDLMSIGTSAFVSKTGDQTAHKNPKDQRRKVSAETGSARPASSGLYKQWLMTTAPTSPDHVMSASKASTRAALTKPVAINELANWLPKPASHEIMETGQNHGLEDLTNWLVEPCRTGATSKELGDWLPTPSPKRFRSYNASLSSSASSTSSTTSCSSSFDDLGHDDEDDLSQYRGVRSDIVVVRPSNPDLSKWLPGKADDFGMDENCLDVLSLTGSCCEEERSIVTIDESFNGERRASIDLLEMIDQEEEMETQNQTVSQHQQKSILNNLSDWLPSSSKPKTVLTNHSAVPLSDWLPSSFIAKAAPTNPNAVLPNNLRHWLPTCRASNGYDTHTDMELENLPWSPNENMFQTNQNGKSQQSLSNWLMQCSTSKKSVMTNPLPEQQFIRSDWLSGQAKKFEPTSLTSIWQDDLNKKVAQLKLL